MSQVNEEKLFFFFCLCAFIFFADRPHTHAVSHGRTEIFVRGERNEDIYVYFCESNDLCTRDGILEFIRCKTIIYPIWIGCAA